MIPHLGYIAAAFGISAVVICGMIASLWLDHRDLVAKLAKLESRRGSEP